jgi:nicotinate-nucleotide adenylyltransferase
MIPAWGDRRRLRIGLLGGSFNPAHEGHRHISLIALQRLRLDAVWWLVSPQNPLKPREGMASQAERLGFAQKTARHPRIIPTDIERHLGTRYTVDTLAQLKRRFPCVRFVWLMGADNLIQITRWRRWEKIFASAAVAVFARSPYSPALYGQAAKRFAHCKTESRKLFSHAPPAWSFLRIRLHPASATAIRSQRK